MDPTIIPERWLEVLKREYLDSFIRDGGASVKFAVPMAEEMRGRVEEGIVGLARDAEYGVVRVSSATTRVSAIDHIFFRIAEQIDWRSLGERVLLRLAKSREYQPPVAGSGPLGQRLAQANGVSADMIASDIRPLIETRVFRDSALARDFRVAVTQLCLAELSGAPDDLTRIEVITDWLTGRNKALSAVKPYQIYSRISRNNARHLLESLLLWLQMAGSPGLVAVLDISRVTLPRNPRDDLLYYTKAAMFDAYEVLRQFIDSTDRMRGWLLVVMPSREFLDIEPHGRGIGSYDALKLRVYDEVRDQRLVNPMSALVRLSTGDPA